MIKFDKNYLRFDDYFDENLKENVYENWNIRYFTNFGFEENKFRSLGQK